MRGDSTEPVVGRATHLSPTTQKREHGGSVSAWRAIAIDEYTNGKSSGRELGCFCIFLSCDEVILGDVRRNGGRWTGVPPVIVDAFRGRLRQFTCRTRALSIAFLVGDRL